MYVDLNKNNWKKKNDLPCMLPTIAAWEAARTKSSAKFKLDKGQSLLYHTNYEPHTLRKVKNIYCTERREISLFRLRTHLESPKLEHA